MAHARRILKVRRIGHGGTLDPFASGVLPLLIGRATRLMPYVVGLPKRYAGTIRLGQVTSTDDPTGEPVGPVRPTYRLSDADIERAMGEFVGWIDQRPPDFSAKKLDGRRAHRAARSGTALDLPPQRVLVSHFAPTHRTGSDVAFTAEVGSGTYIRALARDLGSALTCGAHLSQLRRVSVGSWRVEDAIPLESLEKSDSPKPDSPLRAVSHLPRRNLVAAEREAIGHGRALARADHEDGPVALVYDDMLVAVAEPGGDTLRPRVVLVPS